mgnify:CR=1 FL=1
MQAQAVCALKIYQQPPTQEDSDTEEEDFCKIGRAPQDNAPARESHFFRYFKSQFSGMMNLSDGEVQSQESLSDYDIEDFADCYSTVSKMQSVEVQQANGLECEYVKKLTSADNHNDIADKSTDC